MKTFVTPIALLCAALSAPTMAASIDEAMAMVEKLNSKCRGGSGDAPATMQACQKRDAVLASLEKNDGWCFDGKNGQWSRCAAPVRAPASAPAPQKAAKPEYVSLYLPHNGKEGMVFGLNAPVVVFAERPCGLSSLPGYQRMVAAKVSGMQHCAYKRDHDTVILGPYSTPMTLPNELFALAQVDSASETAKVIQPGFTSEQASKQMLQRQQAEMQKSMPGAALPPRR